MSCIYDLQCANECVGSSIHSAVFLCPRAGAVVLPLGAGFPGMSAAVKTATRGPLGKASVFFATAGERGVIKIWSAETGCCVYQRRCIQSQVPCGDTCILPFGSSQVQKICIVKLSLECQAS